MSAINLGVRSSRFPFRAQTDPQADGHTHTQTNVTNATDHPNRHALATAGVVRPNINKITQSNL